MKKIYLIKMNFIYKMLQVMAIADIGVSLYKYMEQKIIMIILEKKYLIILIKIELHIKNTILNIIIRY